MYKLLIIQYPEHDTQCALHVLCIDTYFIDRPPAGKKDEPQFQVQLDAMKINDTQVTKLITWLV